MILCRSRGLRSSISTSLIVFSSSYSGTITNFSNVSVKLRVLVASLIFEPCHDSWIQRPGKGSAESVALETLDAAIA